jgi:hypothetical protein
MVTLLDAPPVVLPGDTTTRITLYYSASTKNEHSRLLEAVKELPDTTILFLQKLQTFHNTGSGSGSENEKTTFESSSNTPNSSRINISRVIELSGAVDRDANTFLLHTENLRMPDLEPRKNKDRVEIKLAFPIDLMTQRPKLSKMGQYVFAY